jgi:hypothetical protein
VEVVGQWSKKARCSAKLGGGGPCQSGGTSRQPGDGRTERGWVEADGPGKDGWSRAEEGRARQRQRRWPSGASRRPGGPGRRLGDEQAKAVKTRALVAAAVQNRNI